MKGPGVYLVYFRGHTNLHEIVDEDEDIAERDGCSGWMNVRAKLIDF